MELDFEEKYLDIGKRIAFYREKRNLSQEQLAKKVNCTAIYIRKIEGNNIATRTTLGAKQLSQCKV